MLPKLWSIVSIGWFILAAGWAAALLDAGLGTEYANPQFLAIALGPLAALAVASLVARLIVGPKPPSSASEPSSS